MDLSEKQIREFVNLYEIPFNTLYVMEVGNMKFVDIKNIKGTYDLDKPKETLENLLVIKTIYDRRDVKSNQLNSEISNFKMILRENRLSKILDKPKRS